MIGKLLKDWNYPIFNALRSLRGGVLPEFSIKDHEVIEVEPFGDPSNITTNIMPKYIGNYIINIDAPTTWPEPPDVWILGQWAIMLAYDIEVKFVVVDRNDVIIYEKTIPMYKEDVLLGIRATHKWNIHRDRNIAVIAYKNGRSEIEFAVDSYEWDGDGEEITRISTVGEQFEEIDVRTKKITIEQISPR